MPKAVSNIAALQERAVTMATDFIAMTRQLLDHAIEMGGVFAEVRAALPHGEFTPWLKANSPLGERQVRKLMQLHRDQHLLPNRPSGAVLSINDALSSISKAKGTSRPALPKPAPVIDQGEPDTVEQPADPAAPTVESILEAARAGDIASVDAQLSDVFARLNTVVGADAGRGIVCRAWNEAVGPFDEEAEVEPEAVEEPEVEPEAAEEVEEAEEEIDWDAELGHTPSEPRPMNGYDAVAELDIVPAVRVTGYPGQKGPSYVVRGKDENHVNIVTGRGKAIAERCVTDERTLCIIAIPGTAFEPVANPPKSVLAMAGVNPRGAKWTTHADGTIVIDGALAL